MEHKQYRFIGTEQDLIDNNFVMLTKKYSKDGNHPLMERAIRDNIKIFLGATSNEDILLPEHKAFKVIQEVYNMFWDQEKEPKQLFQQFVIYNGHTGGKLRSKYPVYDLITKGLVIEEDDVVLPLSLIRKWNI